MPRYLTLRLRRVGDFTLLKPINNGTPGMGAGASER